jgi:pimeloyl-ACP methyl ester carboxylesterase
MTAITTDALIPELARLSWTWRGYQIEYTVKGEGKPLLLIHGFGASIGHWRKNIPVLAEAGYRVFALDLLGFGNSDKPVLDYSLALWQELAIDFWQDCIQQPTILVGNSIGALLALSLASDRPDIAAGTVLINCAGGLNHSMEGLSLPLRLIMDGFAKIVSSDLFGQFIFDRIRAKKRIRNTLKQVYYDRTAITEDLIDMLHQPSCHPNAQKVFASILSAPPEVKPEELLRKLQSPLLVLWGDKDPWTPIEGAKIYRDIPARNNISVDFQSIPQAGHCPHDEKPETVNRLILDWLGNLTQ